THDRRILFMACAAGLPGVLVSLIVLWGGDYSAKVQWTLSVLVVGVWVGFVFSLRDRVVYPLQTISNLLAALREDDFSIRARVEVRRTKFWQGGLPHELLVLADVSQPLREQERQAWQRLIRVIGHELNNSLAPIKSIAGSLDGLIGRTPPPLDWRDDMRRGLAIIASRSDALSRFTAAYARLARLPAPHVRPVQFPSLAQRVAQLETRLPV